MMVSMSLRPANAATLRRSMGWPSRGWNCLGMVPPARSPRPAATMMAAVRGTENPGEGDEGSVGGPEGEGQGFPRLFQPLRRPEGAFQHPCLVPAAIFLQGP